MPKCKLWFLERKNEKGKIVFNTNIGYGTYTIKYADGKTREFYQVGLSANKTGISVYILGINDKTYLAKAYGKKIGKASVSGYCIKFKSLGDVDREVLAERAEQLGFTIGDQELRDSISTNPAFLVGGRFSKDAYLRALRYASLTPGDFEETMRKNPMAS